MHARSDALDLTVIGAGPAYTDRAGAVGAAYLVTHGDTRLLLDLGQGTFARLAGTVDPSTLDAIVVSHLHPDHFVDLVPMRHFLRWEFAPPRRMRPRRTARSPQPARCPARRRALQLGRLRPGGARSDDVRGGVADDHRRACPPHPRQFRVRIAPPGSSPGLVYTGDCGRATWALDPLVRPGDALLSEVSFGPSTGDPGAAHLDGPSVGALAARRGGSAAWCRPTWECVLEKDATIDSVCSRVGQGEVGLVEPGMETTLNG